MPAVVQPQPLQGDIVPERRPARDPSTGQLVEVIKTGNSPDVTGTENSVQEKVTVEKYPESSAGNRDA